MSTAPIDPVMAESSPKWSTEGQYGDHAVAREIGRELREARLAGGKRIANIAEQLRIRADYLDALEEGELERLPARTYAVGFLRSYGTYLGLDGERLVGRLKSAASTGPSRKPVAPPRPRRTALKVLAFLLLGPAAYAGYRISSDPDQDRVLPPPRASSEMLRAPTSASSSPVNQANDAVPVNEAPSESLSSAAIGAVERPREESVAPLQGAGGPAPMIAAPEEIAQLADPQEPVDMPGAADAPYASSGGQVQTPATSPTSPEPVDHQPKRSAADEAPADGGMPLDEMPAQSPFENAAPVSSPASATAAEPAPSSTAPPTATDNQQAASPPDPAPVAARFALQVAAVRDPASVPSEWRRLKRRYASLAGLELRAPRSVEIPGKGTFYRVYGGAFATRAEARAACDRLRSEGGDCRVVAF
jgi:cytoskeleton protein RodZ